MKAAVFLAPGFEECEALIPADMLRRAEIEAELIAVGEETAVTGSRGMTVLADRTWSDFRAEDYDCLILPGGAKGAKNLNACEPLKEVLAAHWEAGKLTCAICAGPSVLGNMGILKDRKYTCFPTFRSDSFAGEWQDEPAVKDGVLVTGRGMGCSIEFAREIIRTLAPDRLEQVENGIQYIR